MRAVTRNERILARAAEVLAEQLARHQAEGHAGILLQAALIEAEEQIGGKPARNPVVMAGPLKALINGHGVAITPKGDDGPQIDEPRITE